MHMCNNNMMRLVLNNITYTDIKLIEYIIFILITNFNFMIYTIMQSC